MDKVVLKHGAGQAAFAPSLPLVNKASTIPNESSVEYNAECKWGALRLALEGLKESLDVFPPLKMAVSELLECMAHPHTADQNRRAYAELASNLEALVRCLQAYISRSKPMRMPHSLDNVTRAIEKQIRYINQQQARLKTRRIAAAKSDEEDILRCYHQVGALFHQLQMDISLSIRDAVQEQQMDMQLKDLSPADDAYYNSALPAAMTKRRGCTPNTRTTVLAVTQSWTRQEDAAKVYWMSGMAGTGKTTIAYSLCERLENSKQLGASYFCSRDSPNCRDVNKLIPTIAYQLGRYSNAYRQSLCKVLSDNPDLAKRDISTQFENLIAKPLRGVKAAIPRDVVVVIDALDECTDKGGLRQVLNMLFHYATELPIKFFVTSRPEPSISDVVIPRGDHVRSILRLHDIEPSLVRADIKTYLTEALASIRITPAETDQLAVRAGRLFIFAATAVRYILPDLGSVNHRDRLSIVLGLRPGSSNKSYQDIDKLYTTILSSALDKESLENFEFVTRQQVLWTVVCAREPLSITALAELLGLKSDQDVQLAIQPLQSVLYVSGRAGVPDLVPLVSTLHSSFPDFLLSKERSEHFHCDEAEHNEFLARRCFAIMQESLQFNICRLETSHRFDKDVPNLQGKVDTAISPGLFYASRYWGEHLSSTTSNSLVPSLDKFLRYRLLFWTEVLSLKGWIGHSESVLTQALNWLSAMDGKDKLLQSTHDARNFITAFASSPASLSTPHIYISMLPSTSKKSHVRENYSPQTRGLLQLKGTAMKARGNAALATWVAGSGVNSIAQSSDGKRIVSGSDDRTVSVWEISKGTRIIGPLVGHQGRVWSVAFCCDGSRIASGSNDGAIHIWDAHKGSLIAGPLRDHAGSVRALTFSPDGTRLVSGSEDCTIRMWDAYNGVRLGEPFEGHQKWVRSVAFSPDGKCVASGSDDRTIRVWNLHGNTIIFGRFEGHTGSVYSVVFSPDGLHVASGSEDRSIRVWDVHRGSMLAGPFDGHTDGVTSVMFSPDGIRLVSGSQDHTIRVWDARTGVLLAGPFQRHGWKVSSVLFSADGARVISGSDDGMICVWDALCETMTERKHPGHTGAIYSVTFSPDGTRAVTGSKDCTVRVWDASDGKLLVGPLEGHTQDISAVAFSPDGARIVSGSDDCTLRTWDAYTGTPLAGPFEGRARQVCSVQFSPDGGRIGSGSSDCTIRVWDSHTGALMIQPFELYTKMVRSIAFSPDGTRIAGSAEHTIWMWNTFDATAAAQVFEGHKDEVNTVVFSPDGTRVASGSDDCTILVWDAYEGTVLHGPFKGHTSRIWSVAFSPDGTRIASGSSDRTVCVWDAGNGTMMAGPFSGHTDPVLSVGFSPDGKRIISGSYDSTTRLWEVAADNNPPAAYLDQCHVDDHGWVTNSNLELMLWLPSDLRATLPRPSNSFVISLQGATSADYSELLLGERWHECYCGSQQIE